MTDGVSPDQALLRAVLGDSRFIEDGGAFAVQAIRRYWRHRGAISLYQVLRLPAPGQWKRFARLERDAALARALALMPGPSDRARLVALEVAIRRFRSVQWPAWRELPAPPSDAADLNKALWHVVRATDDGGLSDLGWRQLGRVTEKSSAMSHGIAVTIVTTDEKPAEESDR
jgi:hypothetical protein